MAASMGETDMVKILFLVFGFWFSVFGYYKHRHLAGVVFILAARGLWLTALKRFCVGCVLRTNESASCRAGTARHAGD
jgi:hypothetical protein